MLRMLIIFLFIFKYRESVGSPICNEPWVKVGSTEICGYYEVSDGGRKYRVYEGIPYALPPVGQRRFLPPVPITRQFRTINATKVSNVCMQYNSREDSISGDEDCLYLNIYTPFRKGSPLLPVIFYIHGGGFQFGAGSDSKAKFLMDRDVILVTFNYRLSALGFISTEDHVISGNMGLKDQNLALRWVKKNIKYFGGHPKRITLTGVSAGGASVHYHYLSPLSRRLFQNGISFSSTALCLYAFSRTALQRTRDLASLVNCTNENSLDLVECLRSRPARDLYEAIKIMVSGLYFPYAIFTPVAENVKQNYFIDRSPLEIMESGDIYDVPWITGVVAEEGLFLVGGFILNNTAVSYTVDNWDDVAPYLFQLNNTLATINDNIAIPAIKDHYLGLSDGDEQKSVMKNQLTYATGDGVIVAFAEKAARLQAEANKSPVWFYRYSYRAAQSFSDYLSKTTVDLGVCHNDDIYMVLENKYIDPTTTPNDRLMLQKLLDFWYSVASKREPSVEVEWLDVDPNSDELRYMHMAGPNDFAMETSINFGNKEFWTSVGFV